MDVVRVVTIPIVDHNVRSSFQIGVGSGTMMLQGTGRLVLVLGIFLIPLTLKSTRNRPTKTNILETHKNETAYKPHVLDWSVERCLFCIPNSHKHVRCSFNSCNRYYLGENLNNFFEGYTYKQTHTIIKDLHKS